MNLFAAALSWLPVTKRNAVKGAARKLRYDLVQLAMSYTPAELETALRRLGVKDGDAILMQSAFNPANGFDGEVHHVIDCVLDVIGPNGHLFMVSMPYDGSAREYLGEGKVFDVRRTPSQMGVISESFRRRKGVMRSANPLHPVLALGPRAEWVVEGHERLQHSCGANSPFEKMLTLGTKALLFDVDLEVLTFTHYLEDLFQASAPVPVYSSAPLHTEIKGRTGQRESVTVYPFSFEAMRARNFAVLYDALLARGLVARERAGNTRLQLVALEDVVAVGRDLVDRGVHIYGAAGQRVRVKPTRDNPAVGLAKAAWDEVSSRRALRDIRKLFLRLADPLVAFVRSRRLPHLARHEVRHDHLGHLHQDPGSEAATRAAIEWLCEAQDRSASQDGGVAHHYSLIDGWSTSYPETTGYIIPTLIEYAKRTGDETVRQRAVRMLDWLVSIQLPSGGFQGGIIGAEPVQAVTFNTGQILFGLCAGVETFADPRYEVAMHRAAQWLVDTQDDDGCWRDFPSPHTSDGEKSYDTHVAWALFEAARLAPHAGYEQAAIRNVRWALSHQRSNGWFGRSCVDEPTQPLTHAIGYVLRGILEAYRFTADASLLQAAERTAEPLLRVMQPNGYLAGRLRSDWSPAVRWVCLTGTAQVATCWLLLHGMTGDPRYLEAAARANQYVRRTLHMSGPPALRGGVKGSFPVDGGYCTLRFPNWAAKFMIDANFAEEDCRQRASDFATERQSA